MQACFFGQYLLHKGILSPSQLAETVNFQRSNNQSLGVLAVAEGFLTLEQVSCLNSEQYFLDIYFGELAVERGLMTSKDVESLVVKQRANHVSIGDVMVELGLLSSVKLDNLLADYQFYKRRLHETCKEAIQHLPSSDFIQIFLRELTKCSQRICHQKIAVGAVHVDGELQSDYPILSLRKFPVNKIDYLGLAVDQSQLERIARSRGCETVDNTALQGFIQYVYSNTCERLVGLKDVSLDAANDAWGFVESVPSSSSLVVIEMVTEDSGFNVIGVTS